MFWELNSGRQAWQQSMLHLQLLATFKTLSENQQALDRVLHSPGWPQIRYVTKGDLAVSSAENIGMCYHIPADEGPGQIQGLVWESPLLTNLHPHPYYIFKKSCVCMASLCLCTVCMPGA